MTRVTRRLAQAVVLLLGVHAAAAAQETMRPVPRPALDGVDREVAQQIAEAHAAVEAMAARGSGGRDLGNAYGDLGRIYHAYEIFESAEAAYANAARLASRDNRWPYLLGYLYQQTGRLEDAARSLLAAERAAADIPALHLRLGDVYLGLNRLREAADQFQRVIDIFPAMARRGLGEVALREGRWQEAIRHFEFALARVPDASALHYPLAMAHRGLGRVDDARRHLGLRGDRGIVAPDALVDGVQTLVRGERALVMYGRRAFEAGQFGEAAAAFRKAADARPESAAARANLAAALQQLGDRPGAIEQYEAALRLDPREAAARAGLGRLLIAEGRRAEAVGHLRAALDLSPGDQGLAVSLAILLADMQQYREALAVLDEDYQRHGPRAAATTTLARLLAASPDRTLRDGERALRLASTLYAEDAAPAHAETVALALAELGRCGEAAEWMRRAVAGAEGQEAVRLRGELPNYESATCRR